MKKGQQYYFSRVKKYKVPHFPANFDPQSPPVAPVAIHQPTLNCSIKAKKKKPSLKKGFKQVCGPRLARLPPPPPHSTNFGTLSQTTKPLEVSSLP